MVSMSRAPPKYSCTICGKTFRRKKQHFNHVMRGHKTKTNNKKVIAPQQIIEPELISLKPEIEHSDPQRTVYFGAPYDYHYPGLVTGNRHLRAGLPFKSDPLRRTLVARPILPKAMPSLGPAPRLSTYRRQAI